MWKSVLFLLPFLLIQPSYGATMKFTKSILRNSKGMEVEILNFGGIVSSIKVPDNKGKNADVVLGFDTPEEYQQKSSHPYFGALIGRYGNRIAKGKFTLNGKTYTLAVNNGPNHLHGGLKGFDKVFWDVKEMEKGKSLKLNYVSPDGEEGYPGTLKVEVTYTLTEENELKIDYLATTDAATPLNLTNHSYFNLSGDQTKTILDHVLTIDADKFTAVDKDLIPTGKLESVSGPMDFRTPKTIGKDIAKVEGGYDHNYVLKDSSHNLKKVATLSEPTSGRKMEVFTTQPGIQLYTGNFLDGKLSGKNQIGYAKNAALCLETQHFPDSPNQPSFPTTILQKGETYKESTIYKFSTNK